VKLTRRFPTITYAIYMPEETTQGWLDVEHMMKARLPIIRDIECMNDKSLSSGWMRSTSNFIMLESLCPVSLALWSTPPDINTVPATKPSAWNCDNAEYSQRKPPSFHKSPKGRASLYLNVCCLCPRRSYLGTFFNQHYAGIEFNTTNLHLPTPKVSGYWLQFPSYKNFLGSNSSILALFVAPSNTNSLISFPVAQLFWIPQHV